MSRFICHFDWSKEPSVKIIHDYSSNLLLLKLFAKWRNLGQ
jgi:hypothetical protein